MLSLKHTFQSTVPDDANPDTVSPSNWNAEHTFTMGADRIVGRLSTDGAAQELTAAQVRTLLNVENGATADQTGAEILALLLPEDGSGSGLDADLLDGNHASAFLQNITGESIGNLSDVSISDVVTGELLVFQSGAWINQTLSEAGIQGQDADLDALSALASTGIAVRSASDTWVQRNLVAGDGLSGSDLDGVAGNPTLDVGAGTGILANADDVAIDKASDANVYSAVSDKVFTTDLIESASASVALTDAATIALDWDAFINGEVTITTNRVLGNPTNGQPRTWRTVLVKSDGGPDTLTFGNQYGGELPTLDDITTSKFYLVTIFCKTATQFLVTAIDGSDA